MHKKLRGFTLIELLVVIAIIGILATIITVSLTSARAKGRDAKRISDIRTLQLALEEYYNDNGFYPATQAAVYTIGVLSPNYLGTLPLDPKDNQSQYSYSAYNATATSNCTSSKAIGYHLGAGLEDASNPALVSDANAAATPSTGGAANCANGGTPTPGFNGKGTVTTNSSGVISCAATGNALSTSQCYDVTN